VACDVFIDYFNAGRSADILDHRRTTIDHSVVTRNQVLTGLGRPRLIVAGRGVS
jgi:hypothetical protein